MTQVTLLEAQHRLPELLVAADRGDCVDIVGDNGRSYRLSARRPRPPVTGLPRAGTCKGLIELSDDFDEPLDELREYMS